MDKNLVFRDGVNDIEVYFKDNEAILVHSDSVLHFDLRKKADFQNLLDVLSSLMKK